MRNNAAKLIAGHTDHGVGCVGFGVAGASEDVRGSLIMVVARCDICRVEDLLFLTMGSTAVLDGTCRGDKTNGSMTDGHRTE